MISFFLHNPGATVTEGWLGHLLDYKIYPRLGLLQPKMMVQLTPVATSGSGDEVPLISDNHDKTDFPDIWRKSVCFGAVMVRKSVVRSVGAFDERFFTYWDDVDYSLRASRDGWSIYDPLSVVIHERHGTTSKSALDWAKKDYHQLLKKHFPRSYYLRLIFERYMYVKLKITRESYE